MYKFRLVKQMMKRLRTFLCLILAVMMPFCFVACKSGGDPEIVAPSGGGSGNSGGTETPGGTENPGENSGEEPGGEQPGGTGDEEPEEPPVVTYVLDEAEVNRVLLASYDVCKDFIIDLNESELLKDDSYTSALGTKAEPILEYVFFPARFVKEHATDFKKDKIYALQPRNQQTTLKYFEIKASESNDKVFATIMINTYKDLTAYFYEYSVSEGEIDSLRLSYVKSGHTSSSELSFAEVLIDFNNSTLELGYGKLLEVTGKTYIQTKFDTKENFASIKKGKWSYSHYQKFDLNGDGEFVKDTTLMNSSEENTNEKLIEMYDRFGFIGAYDKLLTYEQVPNDEKFNLNEKDYFSKVDIEGLLGYDTTNCVFVISEEE